MNKIELYTDQNRWMLKFTGERAVSMLKNLGTDTIPTDMPAATFPGRAMDEVKKLYPGETVSFVKTNEK